MMRASGGMIMVTYAGRVLQMTGSYQGIFALIGGGYLFALLVIHLLTPRLGSDSE